ncbi:hypothetical protein BUALT_Bualt07G0038900 [Buddleja alternifolia]|uniref:NB-ARC domain-containing protein n=1 Tax=Buddleja alternifolia TaxID=168488 RepID=A0AAV6XEP2_9LAMI|nr:hypothetical protein BUALT_Bualt07G0038900 [Buddleja alternifolia]
MGGIGKTTLARFAFKNKYVVEHFHLRAWFTISQEYSIREILSGLLCGIGVLDYNADDLIEISELLYQNLSGRKYLIVIDDMWSTEVWDDLRLFFPDNRNASRIMVTTRLSNVADCLSSRNPYFMNFLDEDKSWNLFSEKAFARESCSPELEKLGKKIVKSCRGLPLAIVVIGGCLSKSNMTREVWEFVAENASSYTNSENDEQCLKILALSYHHLPIHLKPCFLYMRVFPEDHEIQVSKLIKLWISEGFLNSLRAKNLEDVAEEYLKDLIDRNLILIRNKGLTGKVKTCGIHDLLRDLCIRESHEEPFFCIPRVQQTDFKIRKETMCFLCSDGYIPERICLREVILVSQSSSLVNPWVCNACRTMYPHLIRSRFVSVMIQKDGMPIQGFPQPTTLRYFTTNYVRRLNISSFSSLPLLWNLHTLIRNGAKQIVLPFEIWEMPQLRHIKIKSVVLPDPIDNQIEGKDCTILENLNYLSRVVNFRFTEEILKRIANLKKLRIYFNNSREDWSYYSLDNLARLSKLESRCLIAESFSLKIIAFPHSLKKLSLSLCRMSWEDMSIIGLLPNLEVLKLGIDAFEGPEWNPIEGEFLRLKCLSIACIDLKCWRAEDIHFSSLECLELLHMRGLRRIPSDSKNMEGSQANDESPILINEDGKQDNQMTKTQVQEENALKRFNYSISSTLGQVPNLPCLYKEAEAFDYFFCLFLGEE